MIKPQDVISLARQSLKEWSEDKASRLAAALAYYTILSLAPLLVIVVGIAGLVFGEQAAQGQIVGQIEGLVGRQGAEMVQGLIENANRPSGGIMATTIGVVTMLLGAMGVFGQLRDALCTIWEVVPRQEYGIKDKLKHRLLPFLMVLGGGLLLLLLLVVNAVLAAVGQAFSASLPGGGLLWRILDLLVSLLVYAVVFALIFKLVPDTEIAWNDVSIGAIVTAVLFTIGQFAIGLYLGRTAFSSTFGAAGSLVALLVWIYYAAQIVFLGAEFTQVYASKYGSRAIPLSATRALESETHGADLGRPKRTERPR
jgi:membrane protein